MKLLAALSSLLASVLLLAAPGPDVPWSVSLVDVAAEAGLRAPSVYGGLDRKRVIIETNGAGVAFVDVDNDGWADALVLARARPRGRSREAMARPPGQAPTR